VQTFVVSPKINQLLSLCLPPESAKSG
jgi:hypothetical protein